MKASMILARITAILVIFGLALGGVSFWAGFPRGCDGEAGFEKLPPLDPEQFHHIVFLETDWPISWPDQGDYEDLVRRLIEEFQEIHPNVLVELRMVKPWEAPDRLKEMFDKASLPDVYSGPFEFTGVFADVQLPLDDSFEGDVRAGSDPRLVSLVSLQDRLWAWPKWLEVYGLAANRKILEESGIDVEGVRREGWTWEEFVKSLERIRAKTGVSPIILDTTREDAIRYIYMNAGGTSPVVGEKGDRAWARLSAVLEFLDSWRKKGLFPSNAAEMHKVMLPSFWSGKVAIIGPAGPGFMRHVLELHRHELKDGPVKSADFDVVMLPFPHSRDSKPVTPVKLHATVVFRDPLSTDVQKIRAAAEFASFWSDQEMVRLCNALQVYPVRVGEGDWEVSTLRSLGPLIGNARLVRGPAPSFVGVMEESFWGKVVRGSLSDFWTGRKTPRELAMEIKSNWETHAKEEFPIWTRIVPR